MLSKVIKNIKKSNNKYEEKCTHCKSEYDHCAFYRYKTHINFLANKMDGYLQFQVNCKSDFVIYLLECKKYHLQYVGEAETDFNLRLKNHRKDVKLMLFQQLHAILL